MRLIEQLITRIRFIILTLLRRKVITKYIIIRDGVICLVDYRLPNSKKEPLLVVMEHYHVHYEGRTKYVIVKRFIQNQTRFNKRIYLDVFLAMDICEYKNAIEHQLVHAAKEMKYESLTII